jgi:Tol biopolymer transport system component/DNA-binding winged helix-turn-helix (wHTH) protein
MRQQSLRILTYLVEHAGTVVRREELQAAVWPSGTFVEFEAGLYTAVNQMRQALGDSATKPYFIETVPKVGYRFISPVQIDSPQDERTTSAAQDPAAIPSEPGPPAESNVKREKRAARYLWWIAALIATAAAWAIWTHFRIAPPVLDRLRPFTTARGAQYHPAFSPDGEMLAFDWEPDGAHHPSIYVQKLDATSPVRLTKGEENERRPVWSPDGRQIAFLRDVSPGPLAIVSVPLIGAEEHKRAEFRRGATPWFDWSRDGKWFVVAEPSAAGRPPGVVLISVATGERRIMTTPPADWRGDSLPVFSPDSARVAFRRTTAESGVEDIYEVSVAGGKVRRLTDDNRMIGSFCFTRDGGLLFPSKRDSSVTTLWWMDSRGGHLTRITAPIFEASGPSASRDGSHLAFSKVVFDVNIWRVAAEGATAAAALVDSPLSDMAAQYSPDSRRVVFQSDRSGSDDLWVCDAQGANPVRLVAGRGAQLGNPKWSPNGSLIAFEWKPRGKAEIYLVSSEGGAPRKLAADASVPSWSHDGRFVYFASNRSGSQSIWKMPVDGGPLIQVTKAGFAPVESADGRNLYFFRDGAVGEVWRLSLRDGAPAGAESLVVSGLREHDWGNWTPGPEGIFYIPRGGPGASIEYQPFSGGPPRTVWTMQRPPIFGNAGLALSPDGKTLLFAEVDQDDSTIFVQ